MVFAGYGISNPHGWDDYAGADAEGRIALVLDDRPKLEDEDLAVVRPARRVGVQSR